MSKTVKHSVIIYIALIVSFLINLPRTLSFFEIIEGSSKAFSSVSVLDIGIRLLTLFIFSWILLQMNSNWRDIISLKNQYLKELTNFTLSLIIFFITVKGFIFIYQKVTGVELLTSEKGLIYFIYFVVTIVLVFVSRILVIQKIREHEKIEQERLKQQNLLNELNALKNQINPHFLFNSLNSLNSLVRDNEKATNFVNNLSQMYRYILQSGEEDLVTLKEELSFLNNYVHLIKNRYRDNFNINIEIDESLHALTMPSMTLQLLVENAIKHNEISSENPLLVKIYNLNNKLVVENKMKKRNTYVDSTGKGLSNIDKRYFLLKKQHINISDSNEIFKVELPISE